ncbi:SDR family NAD(P)-dependent oxidoreductase [Aquibium sp. LZ166]|uniref:SDR family NAD(P)-dependent oxidoreductase n=1 Tax=Aquibium pacificus TaxID=3153579 RepID=A0ABV3SHB3_9HYPH
MARHIILLTGASSGIGRELALVLAQAGHTVLALARDDKKLRELAEVNALIVPVPFDLTDTGAIGELCGRLANSHPGIDVLINNAAVQVDQRLDAPGYEDCAVEREVALDLVAPILLAKGLLPRLAANRGMVVNVASALALAPKSTAAVYSAAKAGLANFGAALSNQVPEVAVCTVYPPVVDTPMTAGRDIPKVDAGVVAVAIAEAIESRRRHVWIGKAKALRLVARLSPRLAGVIMRRS